MKKNIFYYRQIFFTLISALLIISNAGAAEPIVAVGSGATNVYLAPNGVPVVDIDTANGAGVSHNIFLEYNVETNGLILNNGNKSEMARQSQLAGQIIANQNLNAEAKFILNEVTAPNRTRLEGFTEVLGGKADVIIANPFGITAEGCGFINTDRVTLTTGAPNLGFDGTLNGFNVSGGDLLIQGEGINANAQQILDLVTRSVKIDGQINVPTLNITTGANLWRYADDKVIGAANPSGNTPTYAIDSTLLGGLYAGSIRIIATENGVGVRMLGNAAASGDDFVLTSSGKIEVKSSISAERDIQIIGYPTGADAIQLTNAKLAAKKDVNIYSAGGFSTDNTAVHSNNNLNLDAVSINNNATSGISALNQATITANTGNLDNAGALFASAVLNASSTSGTFTNYANTGTINSGGDINLGAGVTFLNQGEINAQGSITITAPTFKNSIPGGDTREWYKHAENSSETYGYDEDTVLGVPITTYDYTYYTDTWTMSQCYKQPLPILKPQIIATGDITIKGFNTDANENLGGVISGNKVNLTGTGKFTNNDLTLYTEDHHHSWTKEVKTDILDELFGSPDVIIKDDTGDVLDTRQVISSPGAGIYAANDLNATGGFALVNTGTPWEAPDPAEAPDPQDPKGLNYPDNVDLVPGASPIAPTVALPENPNGYFIASVDPNAEYLVESNPLFKVGADFVGSQYMEERYGYSPEKTIKKLGDANYEAYLIRQQLISQTGSNLLGGYASEAEQMKKLMEGGLAAGGNLGLEYGKAPTAEQLAELEEDIVWMVETEVNGQKVLAPVVYLAASTKDSIQKGAVIAANDINMDLASLSNTGGTIAGENTLNIKSKGDITNVSGTIAGGDVSLKSTEGSVVNKTASETTGNDAGMSTVVGKTAEIKSTKNLNIDAAKDITNLGANMEAGGDASLNAGGDVTFDTIENKTASTNYSLSEGSGSGFKKVNEQTTEQIKSGLTTGGNLNIKSGKDITLAGTDAKAGGDANLEAEGDLNLIARDNTKKVATESKKSGIGVGGGLYGTEKTTKEQFQSRNVGSSLEVGGDIAMKSGDTITIQGSELDVAGNAEIEATDVQVLEGRDIDETTTRTETTTFGKIIKPKASGEASAGASAEAKASGYLSGSGGGEAGAKAGANTNDGASAKASSSSDENMASTSLAKGSASVGVEANAKAGFKSESGVKLMEKTVTTTKDFSSKSVGSAIKIGGNLKTKAKETVLLRGAEVEAGGNVDINAKNVAVMAAEDIKTSESKTEITSIGLMNETTGKAEAGAGAKASASGDIGALGPNAKASAEAYAKAEAGVKNKEDLFKKETTTKSSLDITHTGSSIKAGGNLNINAEEKLTAQGSELSGEQGVSVKAKDMEFLAAEDVHASTTKTEKTSFGMYSEAGAKAEAKAQAGMTASIGMNDKTPEAYAYANAKAAKGIQFGHETKTVSEGSTKAQVTTIKSGSGSVERVAENKITDVGTNIEAAGDFTQSAKTIESLAAKDTSYKTESSEKHSAKLGVTGEVGAQTGTKVATKANALAGAEVGYDMTKSSSSESGSTAVVSNIKVGGKVKSVSADKTTLEGTNIESGGDIEIEAGELDYKAAQDTSSKQSKSTEGGFGLSVAAGVSTAGGVDGKLGVSAKYGNEKSSEQSTTAVAGGISSGGNLKIKTTKGDVRLEGTKIDSKGDAEVDAAGDIKFEAATSTSSKTEKSVNAEVGLRVSGNKGDSGTKSTTGANASAGYGTSSEKSVTQEAGGISSGGNLKLKSGKDMTLVGTDIAAKGDASLQAAGDVDFQAAKSTTESSSFGVEAGFSTGPKAGRPKKKEEPKTLSISAGVESGSAKSVEAKAGSIKSGGNLAITTGKDVSLEGTDIEADGAAKIAAGGKVNKTAAKSTTTSSGFSAKAGLSTKQTKDKSMGLLEGGADFTGDSSSNEDKASIKASGGVQIEQNSAAAKAAALIQNPAVAQGAVSGAPVDMKNFSPETKTEFAKQAIANAMGIDPSEVDTSSPEFAELNQKLQSADSVNGDGANSFDLKGFCEALKP